MNKKKQILDRLNEHQIEGLYSINPRKYHNVGIFLQGSQNYNLDTDKSDIDSRLIIIPSLYDLAMNQKPISTTYIMKNEEHVDIKDIRLFIQNLKKQNMNSLEILFTQYKILNAPYEDLWNRIIEYKEDIAHIDQYKAIKSMQGVAHSKMKYLKKPTEGKVELIEKYGYDPKQLHHLLRIQEYLRRYIDGEKYTDCLKTNQREYLTDIKLNPRPIEEVDKIALDAITYIDYLAEVKSKLFEDLKPKEDMINLLDNIQYEIIKTNIQRELN